MLTPSGLAPMQLDLKRTLELTPDEHVELRLLRSGGNGPIGLEGNPASGMVWGGMDDTVSVARVRAGGVLVCTVFTNQRCILVDGQPTRTGGIRGVLTHPEYRRNGFARAAMQLATASLWEELRSDLALLLASEMAVPFYRSLGWRVFHGPVWCEQPHGRINYTEEMPRSPAMLLTPDGQTSVIQPIIQTIETIETIDMCGLPW